MSATRCHCERASMRLTAPAERSPAISTRPTWLRNSSGNSKDTVAADAPLEIWNGASARLCPRVEMACTKPLRAPPCGRSTRASSLPLWPMLAATPSGSVARPSSMTAKVPPCASSRSLAATSAALPSWSMSSLSQTMLAPLAPASAASSALTAASRSGANGCGLSAAAVERASAGASMRAVETLAVLAVGTMTTGRLLLSASEMIRSTMRVRSSQCEADAQPLSRTMATGPEPSSAAPREGFSTGSASAKIKQRRGKQADQRQPPR